MFAVLWVHGGNGGSAMPQSSSTIRKLTRALLAVCAVAVVVAGSAGIARAQDDEEEDVPYDTKLFRSFMSTMGFRRDGDGPGIDYRERSPLVVPPNLNLPPPETTPDKPNAANWPVDPDEKRRKEAIAARKKAAAQKRYLVEDEGRALTPKEMTPGAENQPRPAAAQGRSAKESEAGDRMSVFDLGYKGDMFSLNSLFGKDKGEVAKFQGEPPRANLTEPPTGYRTPSPAQPYGITADRKAGPKAMDLYDRQTPSDVSGKQ